MNHVTTTPPAARGPRSVLAPSHAAALPGRTSEQSMLDAYAAARGCGPIAPRQIRLDGGSTLILPATDDLRLVVAPVTMTGPVAADDLPQVARDVFSLALAQKSLPQAEVVLLFSDPAAKASVGDWLQRLTGGHAVTVTHLAAA